VDKKTVHSESSFARTVRHLRQRVGRIDPLIASHMGRLDMAVVALYVAGDEERDKDGTVVAADTLPRGVIRYFDVRDDPPRRGRPVVASTMGLEELVDRMANEFEEFSFGPSVEWVAPEDES